METQQTPQVIQQPFAAQGDKNTIPNAATGTNKASLQEGFPPITGTPVNKGGIPPERADFNGAMNLNSQFYFAFQNGWWPTFYKEVSDAIGGYPKDAVLWLFDSSKSRVRILQSLIPNNTYNFNTDASYIGKYWKELAQDGRGLAIGQVVLSQSNLATDNPGCLPLWTGEYYANASTLYPDFYAWVKSHPELCKTKAEYDSAIATYGECPYYVADEEPGSLRLPKLVNYIKMAGAEGITQKGAGLPNLTWNLTVNEGSFATTCPEIVLSGSRQIAGGSNWVSNVQADYSAQRGNPIYGNSDTVQPAHTTLYPWVYAYNAAIPASVAQAAEFQNALASKANADLSNCPPNYDYVVDSQILSDGSWYEVWRSGKLRQGGVITLGASTNQGTVTLLKPFANTNYSIILTVKELPNNSQGGGWASARPVIGTSSFGVAAYGINIGSGVSQVVLGNAAVMSWVTEGQGAE